MAWFYERPLRALLVLRIEMIALVLSLRPPKASLVMDKGSPRKLCARLCCHFLSTALFLSLASTMAGAAEPDGANASAGLFVDVPAPKLGLAVPGTVSRRRTVAVDIASLRRKKGPGDRLALNLFGDASYEGIVEKVAALGDEEFVLRGNLDGNVLSSFALSFKDGVAVMNVRTADYRMFELRHLGNSLYDVRQIDESKYPPCATTEKQTVAAPAKPAPNHAKGDGGPGGSDSGATIDVLAVYTPAARDAAGGTAAIQALLNLAAEESNTAYERSQITPRIRLVHQEEINYTESATFDTDLDRLTNPSDGYIDQVHALRDTYGADLVCMLINNADFCGLAWVMGSLSSGFESSAFSVVHWDCATGYYSFAHELGHNMGCAHDRQNANGPGLYPYSYGWRFTTAGNVTNRTIMSYAPGERLQNFSNPNVMYEGVPTGVPINQAGAANNALTINNSAVTVANFRQSLTQCGYAIAPVGTTFSNAAFSGSFSVSASNTCNWSATSQSTFISLTGATNGTGNGSVVFSVATNNTGLARTGAITIAGMTFTVTQTRLPCDFVVAPSATNFTSLGGNAIATVTANSDCAWTATSLASFINVYFSANGSGTGTVSYSVAPNNTSVTRTGTVSIAGQSLTVIQAGQTQTPSLPIALETPGLPWSTGGASNWFGQSAVTHDGLDAARSGTIGHNQQSWMETLVNGPGTLTFWWKVSSEPTNDQLQLIVDGITNQSISGEVDWELRAVAIGSGSHVVRWTYAKNASVTSGQDAAWVDQVQLPLRDFRIASLSTNATVIDHESVTGDDRGGIAASSSQVFYTGDTSSGRFNLTNLSGGTALGTRYDGLVSDLRTETVYVLARGNAPITGTSFNGLADRLLEISPGGTLTGHFIDLSQPIPISGTNGLISTVQVGLFAGYGQIVIFNRANAFSISLPSGLVNDLGPLSDTTHARSENWAYWGVAEYFSNAVHLVYVRDPNTIVRRRVSDGAVSTVATFANLSDMAAITLCVPLQRWYFHHEYGSQFGGTGETLGFAPAQFEIGPGGEFQSAIARLDSATIQLRFRGPPARSVVLQESTDLITWLSISTNALNTYGAWNYSLPAIGTQKRFFRARLD